MDLGECTKIHDLALRADYEIASKEKDLFFELDVSFFPLFCILLHQCLTIPWLVWGLFTKGIQCSHCKVNIFWAWWWRQSCFHSINQYTKKIHDVTPLFHDCVFQMNIHFVMSTASTQLVNQPLFSTLTISVYF